MGMIYGHRVRTAIGPCECRPADARLRSVGVWLVMAATALVPSEVVGKPFQGVPSTPHESFEPLLGDGNPVGGRITFAQQASRLGEVGETELAGPPAGWPSPMPPVRPDWIGAGYGPYPGPGLRPPGRHRGLGQPLLRESWRYRPFGIGWFMGSMSGSTLIEDWTGQKTGYFGGYRLGWDFDHYWGCEMRLGFASVPMWDSQRAKEAEQAAYDAEGLGEDDERRNRYNRRRDTDVNVWDVSLLYYPWGDAAWRPYAMVGLGTSRIRFEDRLAQHWSKQVFGMPLGLGLKYRYNDVLALRFEVADNIIFGGSGGFETLHNLSVTAGVEVRFGGTRTAYWPWNPSRHYW